MAPSPASGAPNRSPSNKYMRPAMAAEGTPPLVGSGMYRTCLYHITSMWLAGVGASGLDENHDRLSIPKQPALRRSTAKRPAAPNRFVPAITVDVARTMAGLLSLGSLPGPAAVPTSPGKAPPWAARPAA